MGKSTRVAYGEALVELGKINKNFIVLDADLANATQTNKFKKEFPDRFYDVGIQENNLMGVAAGFAHAGITPIASTFAIFGTGRSYEIIRNSIAYENLNVKICLTHAGLSVGEDGGSHQSIEDIALMRVLPHMTIIHPCDEIETKKAIKEMFNIDGPVYVRLSRPDTDIITKEDTEFKIGKANVLRDGKDVCIITCGLMCKIALDAADRLKEDGIEVSVVNMHTIKPLDKNIIEKYHKNSKLIVTLEEHSIIGGLGSAVAEVIAGKDGSKFVMIGINDTFGESGKPKELFDKYGLNVDNVIKVVKENIK